MCSGGTSAVFGGDTNLRDKEYASVVKGDPTIQVYLVFYLFFICFSPSLGLPN